MLKYQSLISRGRLIPQFILTDKGKVPHEKWTKSKSLPLYRDESQYGGCFPSIFPMLLSIWHHHWSQLHWGRKKKAEHCVFSCSWVGEKPLSKSGLLFTKSALLCLCSPWEMKAADRGEIKETCRLTKQRGKFIWGDFMYRLCVGLCNVGINRSSSLTAIRMKCYTSKCSGIWKRQRSSSRPHMQRYLDIYALV